MPKISVETSFKFADPVGNALVITKAISQGALLLIGHWYAAREAVVTGTIATELPMLRLLCSNVINP